jgi:hypothetical protein
MWHFLPILKQKYKIGNPGRSDYKMLDKKQLFLQ